MLPASATSAHTAVSNAPAPLCGRAAPIAAPSRLLHRFFRPPPWASTLDGRARNTYYHTEWKLYESWILFDIQHYLALISSILCTYAVALWPPASTALMADPPALLPPRRILGAVLPPCCPLYDAAAVLRISNQSHML
jgi:hypothetical protein